MYSRIANPEFRRSGQTKEVCAQPFRTTGNRDWLAWSDVDGVRYDAQMDLWLEPAIMLALTVGWWLWLVRKGHDFRDKSNWW
jgi:hypothetical protein